MDSAQFLADLRAERDRIDNAITALEALVGTAVSAASTKNAVKVAPVTKPTTTKRVVSAESRQRMAEAQRKRYAAANAGKSTAAKAAKAPAAKAPAATTKGKPMSAATKKRLSELAKKRWAAKKSAAKA